ncbi:Transcriptional adapter ada2 [Microbotryomycetes sp. JL221]|nr:Transcriptional adapter ada2 [Microbotryomycetes sp. JL221]
MTVTKRKQKPRDTGGPDTVTAPTLESGTKASCDSCSADITHNVHMRCAETHPNHSDRLTCPDFDLCVSCFLAGKQVGPHRSTHAYRVISSHAFPIFDNDWGADEELLLIEGAQMYGLGNWADTAEHIGGRTKEDVKDHYFHTYIESDDYPMPRIAPDLDDSQEEFQKRKKARLEELQSRPLALPPPKPLASAPTCHEIAGFMPGRLEFETEYENEAETLVKDMEFGRVYQFGGDSQPAAPKTTPADGTKPEESKAEEAEAEGGDKDKEEDDKAPELQEENDADLELKLSILDMFNEKYDRRMASKELIFDRGLLNYKQISANERKRTKEERDLIQRTKVFARVETAQDHEDFVDGLLYEIALRKRIQELQEWRRMGVTTLSEGERYEHVKSQRSTKSAYRDSLAYSFSDRVNGLARRPSGVTSSGRSTFGSHPRPSTSALTLATSSSLHLLTTLEQQLCSTLRILPKPYLYLKEVLLREWTRLGGRMTSDDARKIVASPAHQNQFESMQVDTFSGLNGETPQQQQQEGVTGEWGEKVERVFEFLCDTGGLRRKTALNATLMKVSGMTSSLRPKTVARENGGDDSESKPQAMDVDSPATTPAAIATA